MCHSDLVSLCASWGLSRVGLALALTRPLSSGRAAEAKRQIPEQGVEEEVRDALRQRAAYLPPQPARESAGGPCGELGGPGGGGGV